MKDNKEFSNESKIEEIISALWAIVSLLCYLVGFKVLAFIFMIKAILDMLCSFYYAIKRRKEKNG